MGLDVPRWLIVVAGGAMALTVVVVGLLVVRDPAEATVEVLLEPASSLGPDPFFDVQVTPAVVGANLKLAPAGFIIQAGSTPGLYGGSGEDSRCDPELLVAFLERSSEKAAAWAGVHGIEVDEISDFVRGLTPVVLLADTWVTNHGYRDGRATARQSILQAGTTVLVDQDGVPRVRCKCGNPLAEARPPSDLANAKLIGEPWPDFELDRVVRVEPGEGITEFRLIDIDTGEGRQRPISTVGLEDVRVDEDGLRLHDIDLRLPPEALVGDGPFDLPGETASGRPISYVADGGCRITNAKLVITESGTCTISAEAEASDGWAPLNLDSSIEVAQRAQGIVFPLIGDVGLNEDPIPLVASADSGLDVIFAVSGACELDEDAMLVPTEVGSCTITASQAGNDEWAEAEPAVQTVDVVPAVDGRTQTITLNVPNRLRLGAPGVTVTAQSTSGLPVAIAASGQCSLQGRRLTATGVGTCRVFATQAGNDEFARASETRSIAVDKRLQTSGLPTPPGEVRVGDGLPLPERSTAGLDLSYGTSGPCAVQGGQLVFSGQGTCVLTASQSGDGQTAPLTETYSFEVLADGGERKEQRITFPQPPGGTFGGASIALAATADSGLPVSYVVTSGPCLLTGSAQLDIDGAGSCEVVASQPGNAEYEPAPNVPRTVVIAKAAQDISFDVPGQLRIDEQVAVSASASSGAAVELSFSGACSPQGPLVVGDSAGTCTVTGVQSGTSNYAETKDSVSFPVLRKVQLIDVQLETDRAVVGMTVRLEAFASVQPVSIAVVAGSCVWDPAGSSQSVGILAANEPTTCTARISQAGDQTYEPASRDVTVTFVLPEPQVLTVTAPSQLTGDQSVEFTIRPTSGVTPVSLELISGPCDYGGEGYSWSVVGYAAGTCTFTATGEGNAEWNAPPPVGFQIEIVKDTQELVFTNLPVSINNFETVVFQVRNTSFLNVTPSISGPCFGGFTFQDSLDFEITGAINEGTTNFNCIINFSNAGNDLYLPYFGGVTIQVLPGGS